MKFKPKPLLQKVMALLIATISILALTITASASFSDQGGGEGPGGSYTGSDFMYSFSSNLGDEYTWLLEVYVSARDDGTIDPSVPCLTESFLAKQHSGSNESNMAYVGSIFYASNLYENTIIPNELHIADRDYLANTKPTSSTTSGEYAEPYFHFYFSTADGYNGTPFLNTEVDKWFGYSAHNEQRIAHILNADPCGLPTKINSYFNYDRDVAAVIESESFT